MHGFLPIPHIALFELHTVSTKRVTVFLLKRASAMMLFLCFHVLQYKHQADMGLPKRRHTPLRNSARQLHSAGNVWNTDDLLYSRYADLASPFRKGRG